MCTFQQSRPISWLFHLRFVWIIFVYFTIQAIIAPPHFKAWSWRARIAMRNRDRSVIHGGREEWESASWRCLAVYCFSPPRAEFDTSSFSFCSVVPDSQAVLSCPTVFPIPLWIPCTSYFYISPLIFITPVFYVSLRHRSGQRLSSLEAFSGFSSLSCLFRFSSFHKL